MDLPSGVLTDDLREVIDDPEIEVVAQLMGGLEPARSVMLELMEAGKDIVTANKHFLQSTEQNYSPVLNNLDGALRLGHGNGGIPIVANISQCLSANQIVSLEGILNGTSNFIVSQMDEHGSDYDEVVAEAQKLGYAEAIAMDVDGTDAAQKLAILSHLSFAMQLTDQYRGWYRRT